MVEFAALIAVFIWNVITFAMYGMDKRKSKTSAWRTSEATLILCAFFFGGIGAFLGMRVFRHKTKHMKFTILIPLAVAINIAVVVLLFYFGIFDAAQLRF